MKKVDYKYNIRGWLTDINDINNLTESNAPQDLFAFKIHYNTVTSGGNASVVPLYNGNISGTQWRTASDNIRRKYGYTYDHQNRLTDAWYSVPGAAVNGSYNEHLSYDSNGNILSLQRYGEVEEAALVMMIDDLDYGYDDGNKLLNVTDYEAHPAGFDDGNDHSGMGGQDDFEYDGYGNLAVDRNKGITEILYNHLNLPKRIVFEELGEIDYLYDANGVKLKKKVTAEGGSAITNTHYLDGFQYTDDHLDFFPHVEGYVNVLEYSELNYVYTYKDHLGNIRLRYALDPDAGGLAILEEDHYYPFGLKHRGYNSEHEVFERDPQIGVVLVPVNPFLEDRFKYKLNSREYQDELGLNMYAMDVRMYDPAIARWVVQDPVIHFDFSPYSAFDNNPVFWADPSGADSDSFFETDMFGRAKRDRDGHYIPSHERGAATVGYESSTRANSGSGNKREDEAAGGGCDDRPCDEDESISFYQFLENLVYFLNGGMLWEYEQPGYGEPPQLIGASGIAGGAKAVAMVNNSIKNLKVPSNINMISQGKHIVGHDRFIKGRSILEANPQNLINGVNSGTYNVLRTHQNNMVVDFCQNIGTYYQNGKAIGPTQYGTVHFGSKGSHIVPANPIQY